MRFLRPWAIEVLRQRHELSRGRWSGCRSAIFVAWKIFVWHGKQQFTVLVLFVSSHDGLLQIWILNALLPCSRIPVFPFLEWQQRQNWRCWRYICGSLKFTWPPMAVWVPKNSLNIMAFKSDPRKLTFQVNLKQTFFFFVVDTVATPSWRFKIDTNR